MVKAKDILYKVATILSIVFAIIWAILAVVYVIFGVIGIVGGAIQIADGSDDGARTLGAGIGLLFAAVAFAVLMVFCFVNLGVCKKAAVQQEKNLYIASIVFGVLSGTEVGIVAGIFGLILLNQNQNKQAAQTVEAKPVEEAPAKDLKPAEEEKADDTKAEDSADQQ